jgi:hypothetical protein
MPQPTAPPRAPKHVGFFITAMKIFYLLHDLVDLAIVTGCTV